MKNAIWSRRNFITVSSLAVIAAAVPVAAAKAASKVVYGSLRSVIINGKEYIVKGTDVDAMWLRGKAWVR